LVYRLPCWPARRRLASRRRLAHRAQRFRLVILWIAIGGALCLQPDHGRSQLRPDGRGFDAEGRSMLTTRPCSVYKSLLKMPRMSGHVLCDDAYLGPIPRLAAKTPWSGHHGQTSITSVMSDHRPSPRSPRRGAWAAGVPDRRLKLGARGQN